MDAEFEAYLDAEAGLTPAMEGDFGPVPYDPEAVEDMDRSFYDEAY